MFTRRHEQDLREIKALAYELAQSVQEVHKRISETRNEVAPRGPLAEKQEEEAEAVDLRNLNAASFEQFRELGMSITQAQRVIAYRDRHDGFDSVDDLDVVPGFPRAFLAELKAKLTP